MYHSRRQKSHTTTKVNAELTCTLHLPASLYPCTLPLQQQLPTTQLSSQQQEQKLIGRKCCITTCANSPQQLRPKHELLPFICPVFAAQFISSGEARIPMNATHLPCSSMKKKNQKTRKPTNIIFNSVRAHVRYPLNHWPSQKRLYQHLGPADPTTIPPNLRLYQLLLVSLIRVGIFLPHSFTYLVSSQSLN